MCGVKHLTVKIINKLNFDSLVLRSKQNLNKILEYFQVFILSLLITFN